MGQKAVHPRVGGERVGALLLIGQDHGSSPRGRGTPVKHAGLGAGCRFIPAWAGNAHSGDTPSKSHAVHPRVGGERVNRRVEHHSPPGSSPRGRGTQRQHQPAALVSRFIPAWAGNAIVSGSSPNVRPVHPRVGGERRRWPERCRCRRGSSPRGRGTHRHPAAERCRRRFIPAWAGNARPIWRAPTWTAVHPRVGGERDLRRAQEALASGSSPRGRGTPVVYVLQHRHQRFIPAWAGNAWPPPHWPARPAVHPRVGGERRSIRARCAASAGSSPRGRGTPCPHGPIMHGPRFIPAWAGNARPGCRRRRSPAVHPRVGGERAESLMIMDCPFGSSPRGRGTPHQRPHSTIQPRFIPAWAGNASMRCRTMCRSPVHPRVGGERATCRAAAARADGSSPRGRGTRRLGAIVGKPRRFIPAWAGNARTIARIRSSLPVHPRVGGERMDSGLSHHVAPGSSPRGRGTRFAVLTFKDGQRFIPAWAGNACIR